MDTIFGIGFLEFLFIAVIALIALGPKDMQKAGKTLGKWMRKIVLSPEWREIKEASQKIKDLPAQLMREANLDEFEEEQRERDATTSKKSERIEKSEESPYGAWAGKVKTYPKIAPPASHAKKQLDSPASTSADAAPPPLSSAEEKNV